MARVGEGWNASGAAARTVPRMNGHSKQRIALRYWLLGAGYHRAVEAMTFAESYHCGTRKDGVTPEFAHQVGIAAMARTHVRNLRHPEETIATGFLHDVREDYDVPDAVIRERFGDRVADATDTMTKTFRGVRRDDVTQFGRMAENPISSVKKLFDRSNNLGSMVGVFTPEKMAEYVEETHTLFLPMLKTAKRNFPDQEPVYENAKLILTGQLDLLAALLAR